MKILIVHHHPFELWQAPPWLSQRLAGAFPELTFQQLAASNGFSRELVSRELEDTEIFIGWSILPEQFAEARRLQWIHAPTAAVHQLMFPALVHSSVRVTSSTGVHGAVVAEHALSLLLALAKRLPQAMRLQARRIWSQEQLWSQQPRPREVSGATVAVIGMGGIGREFTARAKALGMRVLAVRQDPSRGPAGADAVFSADCLDEVLPQADYVLLCTPVTVSTERMISQSRLERMKPDAYLINVARGNLVDEQALLNVLKNHRIAGAALDVFNDEPLSEQSPFWSLENVLITPHTAAVTEKLWERHYRLISENLTRFLAGSPLLNEVDKQRGY